MEEMGKEDGEIEEGECSDQDDMGVTNLDASHEAQKILETRHGGETNTMYRQGRIPQIIINSDQSEEDDSDDDDDYPSHGKKSRSFSNMNSRNETSSEFVNPLRAPGVFDLMANSSLRKQRNNVWGAVMTEQMLSQDIKQFGVNAAFPGSNRDVESYDFTIAKEDDREDIEIKSDCLDKDDIFGEVVDLEREVTKYQNRKRKRNVKDRLHAGRRNVKDRLGEKDDEGIARMGQVILTEADDVDRAMQAITGELGEQNITLFTRIVKAVGNEKAVQLYNMTVDVENSGGMLINNGNRRRTPGGVYIQLLRNDSSIPADVIKEIFAEVDQKWKDRQKEIRKIKKAARNKWKKAKKKQLNIDFDRPETPTPPDDLDDLDNVNDLEVDATDLPDRPDTPEPKDSSDNESGEEEEEEEEDDIAVAIAKAKAAILKKQSEIEMSEKKVLPDRSDGDGVDDDSVEMS